MLPFPILDLTHLVHEMLILTVGGDVAWMQTWESKVYVAFGVSVVQCGLYAGQAFKRFICGFPDRSTGQLASMISLPSS